jgi:hypothetical protein
MIESYFAYFSAMKHIFIVSYSKWFPFTLVYYIHTYSNLIPWSNHLIRVIKEKWRRYLNKYFLIQCATYFKLIWGWNVKWLKNHIFLIRLKTETKFSKMWTVDLHLLIILCNMQLVQYRMSHLSLWNSTNLKVSIYWIHIYSSQLHAVTVIDMDMHYWTVENLLYFPHIVSDKAILSS